MGRGRGWGCWGEDEGVGKGASKGVGGGEGEGVVGVEGEGKGVPFSCWRG